MGIMKRLPLQILLLIFFWCHINGKNGGDIWVINALSIDEKQNKDENPKGDTKPSGNETEQGEVKEHIIVNGKETEQASTVISKPVEIEVEKKGTINTQETAKETVKETHDNSVSSNSTDSKTSVSATNQNVKSSAPSFKQSFIQNSAETASKKEAEKKESTTSNNEQANTAKGEEKGNPPKVGEKGNETSKDTEQSVVKEITPKSEENIRKADNNRSTSISSNIVSSDSNEKKVEAIVSVSTDSSLNKDNVINISNEEKSSDLYFLKTLSIGSSIFMQLVLLPSVFKILKKRSTGESDGLTYIVLFFSSFLWLVYGILLNNSAIIFPNSVGLLLGLFYTIIYHVNCKNMWLKHKLYSYYKTCGTICFMLYIFLYILSYDQYELFVGFMAFISSIVNFGAPLSYIQTVIKKRNSSLIPLEISIGSLICSFLWLTYGFILKDVFLITPNLCGFVLSILQIALILLYSNKEVLASMDTEITYSERNNNNNSTVIQENNGFFNEFNLDDDFKITEVPTNLNNSIFDTPYDETSPLTGHFDIQFKHSHLERQNYLNNSENKKNNINSVPF
ncbi:MtN3-like protein [Plasmodium vinckei vinckei]|uniref:Sugar transporter SWEET1 n=1 Tax=Plasmodium vinckei vinckei TaxID=54757 RepID=A0A449BN63_PLAVN|nr:MtN3-like protein [Plasmodium vinckei vinckei]VEV54870.1 MtN3-like protein [Plasmodium vinckei vinckei]